MLRFALEGIPQFKVSEIEKSLPVPSYTIQTLRAIFAEANRDKTDSVYYMLLGEDVARTFHSWQEAEEIVNLVPLLIGVRSGFILPGSEQESGISGMGSANQHEFVRTRFMDISSTEVRHRLVKGLYCGHLVPEKVLGYIEDHKLYR